MSVVQRRLWYLEGTQGLGVPEKVFLATKPTDVTGISLTPPPALKATYQRGI